MTSRPHADIARDIRALRAGLSRERAAAATGIAVRTLAGWESGDRLPSPEKFAVYCAYFGVDPESIIPPDSRPDLVGDVERLVAPLRAEISSLRSELAELRAELADAGVLAGEPETTERAASAGARAARAARTAHQQTERTPGTSRPTRRARQA